MMKHKLLTIILLLLVASVADAQKTFVIKGHIKGVDKGELLVLAPKAERMDTLGRCAFAGEDFTLTGEVDQPTFSTLVLKGYNGGFSLFVEPGSTYRANLVNGPSAIIEGSTMQDDFNRYKMIVEEGNISSKQMSKEADSLRRAQKFKSASMVTSALDSVMKVTTSRLKELIEKHSDDEFAAFIMLSNAAVKDKLEDKELLYNLLSEKARQTPSGMNLLAIIKRMRALGVGKMAPNFELTDIAGNKVNLYGIRAKIKIVDFWASWCGPCRMENPNMVSLYKDFKSKGLEVISVSLDSSKEKWMQAVNKDKMTWTQVSSLKAWNCPVALQYEVKQVPTIYVLDAYNNIIAKDIRGEELREFVSNHINQ